MLYVLTVWFFLLLHSISLYGCPTVSLSISQMKGIWVVSSFDDCKNAVARQRQCRSVKRLYWAIVQSLPGRAPKREQGESKNLQPVGRGATLIYPGGCGSGGTFPYMVRIGL